MTLLTAFLLRTTMVLAAALVVRAALWRCSAAVRHRVLVTGIVTALAVMPISWVLPAPAWLALSTPSLVRTTESADTAVAALDTSSTTNVVGGASTTAPFAARRSLISLTWLAWLAGALFIGAHRLVVLTRLARQSRRSTEAPPRWLAAARTIASNLQLPRLPSVRVAPETRVPVAWGWQRPVVLLPAAAREWSDRRLRLVLLHELAHIRRGDWPAQMLAELLCVIGWCHPLVWLTRSLLRSDSERACDDDVMAAGVAAHDYGSELLALAREQAPCTVSLATVSVARPTSLEGRVVAMLSTTIDRRPVSRTLGRVMAVAALTLALPAAGLHIAAQETPRALSLQVFDPTGGTLPGVAITLTAKGSGVERSTSTEGTGRVHLDDVAPGEYTLEAAVPGFRPLTTSLTLATARDWQRSLTLQVGELQETINVRDRRRPVQNPSAAIVEPPRVGGNIKVPKKLTHVSPDYPPAMRDAGLEGVVPLEALIGRDGTVASVRVLSADVHPDFAQAAERAVSQWIFSPTLLNGDAIEVRMKVSISFSLTD